jgi:hypothetical protein
MESIPLRSVKACAKGELLRFSVSWSECFAPWWPPHLDVRRMRRSLGALPSAWCSFGPHARPVDSSGSSGIAGGKSGRSRKRWCIPTVCIAASTRKRPISDPQLHPDSARPAQRLHRPGHCARSRSHTQGRGAADPNGRMDARLGAMRIQVPEAEVLGVRYVIECRLPQAAFMCRYVEY